MARNRTIDLDVRPAPTLQAAIADWLAARGEFKKHASDVNRDAYNATYFALGEAWASRHPEAADMPGIFERFLRSLIAPESDD